MKTLIGLTGKAGSGKDTVAEYLLEDLWYETYSFAGPLKDACCLLFGWTRDQIDHDREFKEAIDPRWGFSPRYAMQKMGTEYGRELLRDDIWVHMAKVRYDQCDFDGMIIKDVRFENEAEWIRSNPDGILIHILRPSSIKVIDHVSEQGVEFKDGDEIIINDGSYDDLRKKVKQVVSNLRTLG